MSLDNFGSIDIYINPSTLNIEKVMATSTLFNIMLEPGLNMVSLLKKFKPNYADYPAFNALLTELKLIQKRPFASSDINKYTVDTAVPLNFRTPNSIVPLDVRLKLSANGTPSQATYSFKNNQGFLDTFICPVNMDITVKVFDVALDTESNLIRITIFGNYDSLQLMDKVNGATRNSSFDTNQVIKSPALLKHELTNSLNIINMSSILINTELNADKDPDALATYNRIIRDELESAVTLLNIIDTISGKPNTSQISTTDFYKFIDKYLIDIDSIYSIHNDGQINIACPDPVYLNNTYITVQLSWLKIILDNIFKNIYGHLGHTSNKRFTGFLLDYNKEQSCIIININNSIHLESSNNISKCQLYNQLASKHDIFNNADPPTLIPCIPDNQSQGLTIIDTLCTKQNIKWGLYEYGQEEYTFELRIPICHSYSNMRGIITPVTYHSHSILSSHLAEQRSLVTENLVERPWLRSQHITCRQDNKSKTYLNANTQQRQTTI